MRSDTESQAHGVPPRAGARWATRYSGDGVHLFERRTGTNILLDEVSVPRPLWSQAPRQVSIALLNACDLGGRAETDRAAESERSHTITKGTNENTSGKKIRFFKPKGS